MTIYPTQRRGPSSGSLRSTYRMPYNGDRNSFEWKWTNTFPSQNLLEGFGCGIHARDCIVAVHGFVALLQQSHNLFFYDTLDRHRQTTLLGKTAVGPND